jgi:hypothetical protein
MATLNRAGLFLLLCLPLGCSHAKLERKISLYSGCPEMGGVCQKTHTDLKAEVKAAIPDISDAELSEWIEENVEGVGKIKVLPAKASGFSKFTCAPTDDMGVILKGLNSYRRQAR